MFHCIQRQNNINSCNKVQFTDITFIFAIATAIPWGYY